ncbi:MAG TPA: hypothetical protein VG937_11690 [Polyangiaceae bacterium]|nr:hypothetical protein [Polyangiaceae bacterium]
MTRWLAIAVLSVCFAGCGSDGGASDATGGAGGLSGSGGSGGGGGKTSVDKQAVLSCDDRTLVATSGFAHDLATDSLNYYWLGVGPAGIAVLKKAKSGGENSIVTEFPGYFSFLTGATDLPVSGDSQFYMDDTVADDADEYIYFSGDTQIWRVKKDGTEPVQPVSGTDLNELGPATCNFARSVLGPDALYTCRQGRLFRMDRAGGGQAVAVYSAPEGESIDAFAVSKSQLFVNGSFDDARHLSPILALPLAGGDPTEYGAMLAGLVPDALVLMGDTLLFNSLVVLDGGNLATTSEWASRQGTYKLTSATATPEKISETNLELVRGVGQDSKFAYAVVGDQIIERISPDGVTSTYVDCRDSADDVRFQELVVDDDGVYIRHEDNFYRFGK